jgi:hypothetical protein
MFQIFDDFMNYLNELKGESEGLETKRGSKKI